MDGRANGWTVGRTDERMDKRLPALEHVVNVVVFVIPLLEPQACVFFPMFHRFEGSFASNGVCGEHHEALACRGSSTIYKH